VPQQRWDEYQPHRVDLSLKPQQIWNEYQPYRVRLDIVPQKIWNEYQLNRMALGSCAPEDYGQVSIKYGGLGFGA
jgi:hypothetical protein